VLLASIPAAAVLGLLGVEQLYVVGMLVGTLSLFSIVASSSFLPAVVKHAHLVEANGRLQAGYSAAQTVGPGLAGALVQFFTAPVAILADVASFLCSATLLAVNRTHEPAPPARAGKTSVLGEAREGLRAVWTDRALRALVGAMTTFNLFGSLMGAVYLLYVTRTLAINPVELGMITAAGGAGGIAGSVLAARTARRVGLGPALVASLFVSAVAVAFIPAADVLPRGVAPFLAGREALFGVAVGLFAVNLASLLQAITPAHLLGRMTATRTVTSGGAVTLGALAGGALGDAFGLATTLWVGAAGVLLSIPWLFLSPVYRLRAAPNGAERRPEPSAS
jgi:predicted MFS family arabinose efflux permease